MESDSALGWWVRGCLVLVAAGLTAVFVTGWRLHPYNADGSPLRMETHRQLGLPPCSFYDKTGVPCPSCGMTTSFSLLIHGDVINSLHANFVGTLLASFCLLLIPWSVVSAVRNRALFVTSLEKAMIVVVLVLLTLMLTRWALVVGVNYFTGTSLRI